MLAFAPCRSLVLVQFLIERVMARPQTIEICKRDLFTEETALYEIYPEETVQRLLRLREEYTWFLANPDAKDRVTFRLLRLCYLRSRRLRVTFIAIASMR